MGIMAEQLNAILAYLEQDVNDREARRTQDSRKGVRNQLIKATRVCDGSSAAAVRDWIRDVEVTRPYFTVHNRDADTLHVVSSTLQGPMRHCYERFMSAQPNRGNVAWEAVKAHLRKAYLTQDEDEFLRSRLEKLKQGAYVSNAAYGRDFQELADQAYPNEQRNGAVDKIILNLYMTGLRNQELVRRLIQEIEPDNLQEAMEAVELFSAQEERVQRLWKKSPLVPDDNAMEIGEATSAEAKKLDQLISKMDAMSHKVTGLQTEVAKIKTQASANPRRSPTMQQPRRPADVPNHRPRPGKGPSYTADGQPICYECGKPGHIGRNCEVRQRRFQQGNANGKSEN